jgi:hypothetical protein
LLLSNQLCPGDFRAISLGSYRRAVSPRKTGLRVATVFGLTP